MEEDVSESIDSSSSSLDNPVGMTCPICLKVPLLPVTLTCFPCYSRSEVHCHTYTRFCLVCAMVYLRQMPLQCRDDDEPIRCLYCPEQVLTGQFAQIDMIMSEYPFQIDFWWMRLLDEGLHESYRCPLCVGLVNDTLTFSTQMDLFRHVKHTCDFTYMICQGCGQRGFRKDESQHKTVCPFHKKCPLCDVYVVSHDLPRHTKDNHQHVTCTDCTMLLPSSALLRHSQFECLHRTITCRFCQATLPYHDLHAHLEKDQLNFLTYHQDLCDKIKQVQQSKRMVEKHLQSLWKSDLSAGDSVSIVIHDGTISETLSVHVTIQHRIDEYTQVVEPTHVVMMRSNPLGRVVLRRDGSMAYIHPARNTITYFEDPQPIWS